MQRKLLALGVIAFFTIPIFRSGGRTGLTGFEWLKEHTIWGSPVQYVPEEDYEAELEAKEGQSPSSSQPSFLTLCHL